MKYTPKVSVLMPVYKTNEVFLRQAIDSILLQTFADFEFLILDDCPTEPVENIVNSYKDKRIKYIKNQQNIGISASRNKLIDMAQGEYLAIMDHDDIALPKRFAKEVEFLDSHPEVGVVGTWYECFPKKKLKKKYVINSQIERDLMQNCSILHPSAMIRKSVLHENNLRYEAEFSPAEDYALWGRLVGKTQFANLPQVLQKYRDHSDNTSKTQADKMKIAGLKVRKFLAENHPQLATQSLVEHNIKICCFTLFKRQNIGCNIKYTIFGLIKFRTQEKIIFDS